MLLIGLVKDKLVNPRLSHRDREAIMWNLRIHMVYIWSTATATNSANLSGSATTAYTIFKVHLIIGIGGHRLETLEKNDHYSRLFINIHWSARSECSASCGIGITMRTRSFINHLERKRCPHINIVEKQKCMQPDYVFKQIELPDPMCPTMQWSDWSQCTAICGRGVTIRTRLLLLEDESITENCTKTISKDKHTQT
uniref:Spondin-like TSP1 domain-containing protein n=1 Tax=Glossina palpalis gambiensis TaxID=67801 RepID=A0A1B0BH79_9MUSC